MHEDVLLKLPIESTKEEYTTSSPTVSGIDQQIEMASEPPKPSICEFLQNPSSSASSTSDSSSSDSDSESSSTSDSPDEIKHKKEDFKKIAVCTQTKIVLEISYKGILTTSSI